MTFSYVGGSSTNFTDSLSSLSVGAPTGLAAGDLDILCVIGVPDTLVGTNPTVTPPGGWTEVDTIVQDRTGSTRDLFVGLWWQQAVDTGSSITVSVSGEFVGDFRRGWGPQRFAFRRSGEWTLQESNTRGSVDGFTVTGASVTSPSYSLVLDLFSRNATGGLTFDTANGFTLITGIGSATGTNLNGAIAYKTVSSAGAVTMPVYNNPDTSNADVAAVFTTGDIDYPQIRFI